ncbi:hypothetical protein Tco_1564205 [Tanacetum coccineum]
MRKQRLLDLVLGGNQRVEFSRLLALDIINLHECIQTLDSNACTSITVQEEQNLDLSVGTLFNLKKERIKAWLKENVMFGRPRVILFNIHDDEWKSFQSQHHTALRYKRWCYSLIPAESNSLPHAHAQTTKTYYKYRDSRIKKAQELKTKTFATLIFKIFLKDIKITKTKIFKGDC